MAGKVLGRMLEVAEIGFLYFYGSLEQHHRDKALEDFREDPEKRVMVR
jgi:superfamily II DNA/RNA helicase